MKFKITIFLLFICYRSFGQTQGALIQLYNGTSYNNQLYIYDSISVITADYKNIEEVTNNCPELLLKSVLSATSQNWVDYNYFGGSSFSDKKSEEHFITIKNMNHKLNFFSLSHKLEFQYNNEWYCVIKYFINSEYIPKPMSAVSFMVQKEGRWYLIDDKITGINSFMIMRIKSSSLYDLIYHPNKNEIIRQVYGKISDINGVNLNKLSKEFNTWYEKGNEKYKKYFIDEKAW